MLANEQAGILYIHRSPWPPKAHSPKRDENRVIWNIKHFADESEGLLPNSHFNQMIEPHAHTSKWIVRFDVKHSIRGNGYNSTKWLGFRKWMLLIESTVAKKMDRLSPTFVIRVCWHCQTWQTRFHKPHKGATQVAFGEKIDTFDGFSVWNLIGYERSSGTEFSWNSLYTL